MQLNYKLNINNICLSNKLPVILLHGLFGNLDNLNYLAHNFTLYNHLVLQIDLRNHGLSPHHHNMSYNNMAKDVIKLLNKLLIQNCIVIGHSMGGKVAMKLCSLSSYIIGLIVIDIAPVSYPVTKKYNTILNTLSYIKECNIYHRYQAKKIMTKYINNSNIISFLLKSFNNGSWFFSIENIKKNIINIVSWDKQKPWYGKALFIKGSNSLYIDNKYYNYIIQQFPYTEINTVTPSGHWVHAEQPKKTVNLINDFVLRI